MNELNYETPEVEVVEVAVEQGFAQSGEQPGHGVDDLIPLTPPEEDVKEEIFN